METRDIVSPLLASGISLVCFDFAGSGLSDGEYISLGYYERDDIDVVVQYLRDSNKVSMIGLWGRSMGAVTTLMHADRDHSLAGICLDSPFADLSLLSKELVSSRSPVPLPDFIVEETFQAIRETIKQKAGFDIYDLNPLKNNVSKSFIPAYFISAKDDELIAHYHAKMLHDHYQGDKHYKLVEGTHNSQRPQFIIDSIIIFFINCFSVAGKDKDGMFSPEGVKGQSTGGFNPDVQGFMTEDEMLAQAIKNSLRHK